MKIDALQKYQNQLLSAFNAEQLQYLKYDNWTGLLTETDRLYATMFHDWDVLQKDSSDLAEAVQSLEWTVAPYVADGKEADAKAQDVAKTVTDALWKRSSKLPGTYSHTFPQLLNALVHALFRGFNVHEIEWVNDGELVYPAAFHQLPPQYMRWEDRAGELDRLLFVSDGETAKPKPFPANKYIVALNTSGPDHPLYNAMYYSLIAWYGAYKFGLGWFMEYCQKYGMPKLVFHYESDRDRQQLEADLAEERVLNNILLKGDRTVDIANAPASGASLPQRELLNLAESQCHKLILGQTLTSDTSEHGGSLAQARVHAGVQAEVVKKRAAFVADVLNTQLIPAIVLLNYGTTDVPMPELVFKLPQEGVTLERVQVIKTALEIKGMRIKKSEAYEFMGFAQPAEGDDVFEAASETPQQGGFGAMFGQQPPPGGKAQQKGKPEPEAEQEAEKSRGTEPVSAANAEEVDAANPYGCNQYGEGWKAPHNGVRTRKIDGKNVTTKRSNFNVPSNYIENYSEKSVKVYIPGHERAGFSSYVFMPKVWLRKNKTTGTTEISVPEGAQLKLRGPISYDISPEDIEDSFESAKNDRNRWKFESDLEEALYSKIEKEDETLDGWDIQEKVDVIINQWKEDREKAYDERRKQLIEKIDDSLNEAEYSAEIRKANKEAEKAAQKIDTKYAKKYNIDKVEAAKSDAPTDPAQEWLAPIKQKFLEARKAGASMADLKQMLLTMHPDTKALAKAFANNILAGFAGESEEVDAANPYGCNQYGEGWRMPHNGRASKAGAPVKKTDPTEEERKLKEEEERQRQEEHQRKEEEERKAHEEEEKKAKEKHPVGQATTREEAIEHTRSLLSPEFRETGEVEFDDSVSLEQINEINATLKELTDKYPVKTLRRIGTYVDESNTVGAQATFTKIEFNIDHENGGIKGLHNWRPYGYDKVQETGYTRHNVGATNNGISLRDLTTHEYGHVIQAKVSREYEWLQNKKAQGYDISKFDAQYEAMKKWRRVYGRSKKEKGYPPRSDIQRNLSKYAMKNDREFFSECFVARERGEKLPAYIEKGLDDMISFVNMNS